MSVLQNPFNKFNSRGIVQGFEICVKLVTCMSWLSTISCAWPSLTITALTEGGLMCIENLFPISRRTCAPNLVWVLITFVGVFFIFFNEKCRLESQLNSSQILYKQNLAELMAKAKDNNSLAWGGCRSIMKELDTNVCKIELISCSKRGRRSILPSFIIFFRINFINFLTEPVIDIFLWKSIFIQIKCQLLATHLINMNKYI